MYRTHVIIFNWFVFFQPLLVKLIILSKLIFTVKVEMFLEQREVTFLSCSKIISTLVFNCGLFMKTSNIDEMSSENKNA